MAKKKDPATELAEKMLAVLEAQRALGKEAYPLTLQRLAELTDPQAPPELVLEAIGKKQFKDRVILAQKQERAAPLALKEDLEQLAASPLLLEFALDKLCSPASPTCPPSKLKGPVDTKLKKPLEAAAMRQIQDNTLPPNVGHLLQKNKPFLFLHRIPPPPPPAPPTPRRKPEDVLAEGMLAVLEAQRGLGNEAYPLTLQRLAALTDPQAPPELVLKAVGKKPFKDGAVMESKSNPAGLVALGEDANQLAGDPRLLEPALEKLCTPEMPLWPLSKVQGKIENTKLRKPFEDAITRQVNENTLPQSVGVRLEKSKPLLYLRRIPPPELPPGKPEDVLAEKLLQVLEAQKQLGGDSYPLSLKRLVELADPQAAPDLIDKAVGKKPFKGHAVVAEKKSQTALVFLNEDQAQLLSSGWLLEFLMGAKRQPNENAFAVEALLPKKSPLLPSLQETVNQQIETNSLPPTVGWMWIGGKRQLFLLEDIHSSRPAGTVAAPPATPSRADESQETHETHQPHEPPSDFAPRFDEAFAQLNRRNGDINFVSLVEMRKALPMPADSFNAELRTLRVAGRYTLSGAEGRHGISSEEHTAGIVEDGSLLLYVSRKAP